MLGGLRICFFPLYFTLFVPRPLIHLLLKAGFHHGSGKLKRSTYHCHNSVQCGSFGTSDLECNCYVKNAKECGRALRGLFGQLQCRVLFSDNENGSNLESRDSPIPTSPFLRTLRRHEKQVNGRGEQGGAWSLLMMFQADPVLALLDEGFVTCISMPLTIPP